MRGSLSVSDCRDPEGYLVAGLVQSCRPFDGAVAPGSPPTIREPVAGPAIVRVLNVLKNSICETHLAADFDADTEVLPFSPASRSNKPGHDLPFIFVFPFPTSFTRTSTARRSLFVDIVFAQLSHRGPPLWSLVLRDRKAPTPQTSITAFARSRAVPVRQRFCPVLCPTTPESAVCAVLPRLRIPAFVPYRHLGKRSDCLPLSASS